MGVAGNCVSAFKEVMPNLHQQFRAYEEGASDDQLFALRKSASRPFKNHPEGLGHEESGVQCGVLG